MWACENLKHLLNFRQKEGNLTMNKVFKIGCLVMVMGLLSLPGWSSDNPGMSADNLLIAHNGHGDGDGGGPYGPGDCDDDGPWWED